MSEATVPPDTAVSSSFGRVELPLASPQFGGPQCREPFHCVKAFANGVHSPATRESSDSWRAPVRPSRPAVGA